MGLNITLDNIKVGDKADFMNKVHISSNEDINIDIRNLNIKGYASILNNLNIEEVKVELDRKIDGLNVSNPEYEALKKLLKEYGKGKETFGRKLLMHLESFGEGVAASIVANFIGSI